MYQNIKISFVMIEKSLISLRIVNFLKIVKINEGFFFVFFVLNLTGRYSELIVASMSKA